MLGRVRVRSIVVELFAGWEQSAESFALFIRELESSQDGQEQQARLAVHKEELRGVELREEPAVQAVRRDEAGGGIQSGSACERVQAGESLEKGEVSLAARQPNGSSAGAEAVAEGGAEAAELRAGSAAGLPEVPLFPLGDTSQGCASESASKAGGFAIARAEGEGADSEAVVRAVPDAAQSIAASAAPRIEEGRRLSLRDPSCAGHLVGGPFSAGIDVECAQPSNCTGSEGEGRGAACNEGLLRGAAGLLGFDSDDEGAKTPSIYGDSRYRGWEDTPIGSEKSWKQAFQHGSLSGGSTAETGACGNGSGGGPGTAPEEQSPFLETQAQKVDCGVSHLRVESPGAGTAIETVESSAQFAGSHHKGAICTGAAPEGKRAKRRLRQKARLDGLWQRGWEAISPELQAEVEKGSVSLSEAVGLTLARAEARAGRVSRQG